MKIHKDIQLIDHGLLLTKSKTIIISDLHIGKEDELTKQGLNIPINGYKDIQKRIKTILNKHKPKKFVINGDVKHNFGNFGYEEFKRVNSIFKQIQEKSQLEVIQGNHDKIIKSATNKANITLKHHLKINDFYICHGHKKHENNEYKESNVVIIGHLHPSVGISNGIREEKYKCFIKTKHKNKTVIVTPSFNLLSEGSNILVHKSNTPYVTEDELLKAQTFVVGEDASTYNFGTALDIKRRGR